MASFCLHKIHLFFSKSRNSPFPTYMSITAPAIIMCIKEFKLRLCLFPELLAEQVNNNFAHCYLVRVYLWAPTDIQKHLCPLKKRVHNNCRWKWRVCTHTSYSKYNNAFMLSLSAVKLGRSPTDKHILDYFHLIRWTMQEPGAQGCCC